MFKLRFANRLSGPQYLSILHNSAVSDLRVYSNLHGLSHGSSSVSTNTQVRPTFARILLPTQLYLPTFTLNSSSRLHLAEQL